MKQQFIKENLHHEQAVLWEGQKQALDNGNQLVFGYTPNYLRVACELSADDMIENTIINIKLNTISGNFVKCTLIR